MRIRPFILVTSLVLAGSTLPLASAQAGEPACPVFTSDPAVLTPPLWDFEQENGSFGVNNQRITGIGMELVGDVVSAIVRVQDMKRQVHPGYESTYWSVDAMLDLNEGEHQHEGPHRNFTAFYDLAEDRFRYQVTGTDIPTTPITGSVTTGPNGTVRISATLDQLQLSEEVEVFGDLWGNTGSFASVGDPVAGPITITSSRWLVQGPEAVPIIPCPGASMRAELDAYTGATYARGWVLPLGVDEGFVEERVGDEWHVVATVPINANGGYEWTGAMPRTTHVLRMRAPTPDHGDVISPTVTVG